MRRRIRNPQADHTVLDRANVTAGIARPIGAHSSGVVSCTLETVGIGGWLVLFAASAALGRFLSTSARAPCMGERLIINSDDEFWSGRTGSLAKSLPRSRRSARR